MSIYEARRAQQRFNQGRELSSRFVFDFERSIRYVPGTLAARQNMAATARKYLENLAAGAKGEPALTRELAESYDQLSHIELNAGKVTRPFAMWKEQSRSGNRYVRAAAVRQPSGGSSSTRSRIRPDTSRTRGMWAVPAPLVGVLSWKLASGCKARPTCRFPAAP